MLSRANSDVTTRLRRAKSTSSVPRSISRPLSFSFEDNPTSTYVYAKVAAARACRQHSERMQPGKQRRLKSKRSWFSHNKTLSTPGAHLARQRSDGGRHGRPSTSKSVDNIRSKARPTTSILRPRPSNQGPSSADANIRKTFSQSIITEDDEPYNVVRPALRKTVSIPEIETQQPRSSSVRTASATVFHDSTTSANPSLSAVYSNQRYSRDDIVAATRDKYLKDNQPCTLARRRSFLPVSFGVFGKKNKEALADNGPSFSNNIVEVNRYSPPELERNRLTLGGKARRVSKSLRKRFRRAFDRSTDDERELPAQQVNARQSHFGKTSMMTFSGFSGSYEPSEYYQESNLAASVDHKARIKSSPVDDTSISKSNLAPNELRLHDSERPVHVRSRVTSWNDSSGYSSLNLPEIKQLSSIEEYDESNRESLKSRNDEVFEPAGLLFPRQRGSRPNMEDTSDVRRLFSAVRRRVERSSFNDASAEEYDVVVRPEKIELRSCASPAQAEQSQNISPTIRLLPEPVFEEIAISHGDSRNELCILDRGRDTIMTPSIYSFRDEPYAWNTHKSSSAHDNRKPSIPGTAIVESTKPVTKWNLQEHSPLGKSKTVLTSNEWREWANDEISELDASVPLTIVDFKRKYPRKDQEQGHVREATQIDDSETGIGPRVTTSQGSPTKMSHPRLGHRTSSYMNDRFPMLETSRISSNRSTSSLRQRTSDKGSGSSERSDSGSSTKDQSSRQGRNGDSERYKQMQPVIREEPVLQAAKQVTRLKRNTSLPALEPSLAVDKTFVVGEEEHVLQSRNGNSPSTPQTRRKYRARQSPLDENFLRAIRRGPYLSASPSDEQVRNRTEARASGTFPPKRAVRTENSPPNKGTSPATQRLVKDFLDSRKNVSGDVSTAGSNSSPAFI